MRIGIEAQRLFRPKKHGMDVVALETIRALQSLDSDHELIVFARPDHDAACLAPHPRTRVVEVQAPTYPLWEQVALPNAVARERVDLLHCTANTSPLRCRVPVVLSLHDVIFLESTAGTGATQYQRLGNRYRRWVAPAAARRAEQVITVSNYEREQIAERLPEIAGRLSVVPNAVGQQFWPREDPGQCKTVLERYGLPESYLFFLGNTDPKKNLRGLLEAYALYIRSAYRGTRLAIADLDAAYLEDVLEDLGLRWLRPFIIPTGYIGHGDLSVIYSHCEAFLYPSLRESFGLPILEAMACGAPVMTSRAAAMPEVAGSAAFLVDPTDPEEMGRGLYRLLQDRELRYAMRISGPRHAAKWTWAASAQRLMTVYQKALRGAQGPHATPPLARPQVSFVEAKASFVEISPSSMRPLPNLVTTIAEAHNARSVRSQHNERAS